MVTPIVVCPLEFERRLLQKRGLARRARLECCGPGAQAVRRWVEARDHRVDDPVILAGLAGSLREAVAVRTAHVPGAVTDERGERWTPTWTPADASGDEPAPLVVSTPGTLTTPADKQACVEWSGADLVDLESAAFAEAATTAGWAWTVVRGVSDGPETMLPRDIDGWVDEQGRTRLGTVCRALAGQPRAIGSLTRLRADSIAAMGAVASLIESMLGADA